MTPSEVAMKFASASATCKNGKCPFTSECRGTTETCKMKEVSMIIRAMETEIKALHEKYAVLDGVAKQILDYVASLEKINEQYYRIISSFQNGYRPKTKVVRKDARKKKKKKPTLVEMDGDERYAYTPPKEKPDIPVVII